MKSFVTPIKLYNYTTGYGTQKKEKGPITNALCCVEEIGTMVSLESMAAGISLSCQVEMWKAEYSGQQYCEIGGIEYQIKSSVRTFNNQIVKLLLSKG